MAPMGQVTKVLLLLAVVVPVTAYVAGSLASPGRTGTCRPQSRDPARRPHRCADHRPGQRTDPAAPPPGREVPAHTAARPATGPDGGPGQDAQRGDGDEARVVTPQPTPVGEDDDDEWDDDDGPDDDDTDDERDD